MHEDKRSKVSSSKDGHNSTKRSVSGRTSNQGGVFSDDSFVVELKCLVKSAMNGKLIKMPKEWTEATLERPIPPAIVIKKALLFYEKSMHRLINGLFKYNTLPGDPQGEREEEFVDIINYFMFQYMDTERRMDEWMKTQAKNSNSSENG